MLFGLPGFIQEAALTALSLAPVSEERIRQFCDVRRERFMAGLQGVPNIRAFAPQAGMFLLVDVSDTGLSGYEFMRALYEKRKVSVLDGAAFGRQTAHYVRICFATEEATSTPPASASASFASRTCRGGITWHCKVIAPERDEFP